MNPFPRVLPWAELSNAFGVKTDCGTQREFIGPIRTKTLASRIYSSANLQAKVRTRFGDGWKSGRVVRELLRSCEESRQSFSQPNRKEFRFVKTSNLRLTLEVTSVKLPVCLGQVQAVRKAIQGQVGIRSLKTR